MDLKSLLDTARSASDSASRQQAVRDALAGQDLNLADLETAAAAAFAKLSEPGAGFSDDAIAEMSVIADAVDAIRAEAHNREESASRVAELSTRMNPPAVTTPAETTAPQTEAAVETPAADAVVEADTPGGEPAKELVVAASTQAPVTKVKNQVPLATLPKQLPATNRDTSPFAITAAADLPGYNLGATLGDTEGLTAAVMARFSQLSRSGGDIGGSRAGIASIAIERDERLVANTQHDWGTVQYACDETRLPGGSLLAAGTPGWCAGPEVSYDFCPPAVVDGLVDLPSVTARRGSLIYPQSPEFHTIYSGTGWCYTPAQIDNMQLATPNPAVGPAQKDCYLIPCPDTTSLTLEPCGICLVASILHERAYPELIRYTVEQALVAHAHKMNCRILSQMEALGTAVNLTTNDNLGPGAAATALEAIEMQVEWLRYRHRLGINTTMEMVAPVWMRGILRADLSKRMGVDLLNVTDGTLTGYLTARGVRVQWVLDWQDAFCDPTPPDPNTIPGSDLWGGDASRTAWPVTGKVMIYPAGTFFLARMDVISLEGGLLDSTLLRKNERMALFIEEALKVGKRCYQASVLNINLCASGQTGNGAAIDCAIVPAP